METAVPEELRLLEAVPVPTARPEDWTTRLIWLWAEPEDRVTVTLAVGVVPGERLSLRKKGKKRFRYLDQSSHQQNHCW